jgi:uncharacterized protein involved in exopolysaccharide biosynthesis
VRKITAQENQPGFRVNLGEYLRVLWRKKYFIVVPLVISVVVSNIGVRFLVPEYESSSVIRIGNAASVSSEVERFVQSDIRRRSRDAELSAQLEADIAGSAFLDELIRQLGMDQDPDLLEWADYQRETLYPGVASEELVMRRLRNFLKNRITIDREGPLMFRLSYADADPDACYIIADAITRLYIDLQRRQTMRGLQEVSDFSEEQLAVYKERLDRSERELSRFQEQMAEQTTAGNPVNQNNVALSEKVRNDLDLEISEGESTLEKIRARVVSILGSAPAGERVWTDPEIRKLQSDMSNRRESELLAELSATTGVPGTTTRDETGIVSTQQAIQRRLGAIVAERFANVPTDYRPLVVEYFYQQAEIAAFRTKRARVDAYIRAFRNQVALTPQLESELARLRQEVEHNRSVYNTFKSAQTTSQISEAAQNTELGATIFLIEAASKPLAPVRPDKVKILVLAFMFGVALGSAGLLVTEFTDSSFRNVDEVEKQLGVKVLGTIPRFDHTRWFHDSARRRAVIWTATSLVLLVIALSAFYFYGKSSREELIDLHFTNAPIPGQRQAP